MTVETEPGAQAYVDDFSENGFVRVPKVFSPTEVAELRAELDWLISEWAERMAWTGGWRAEYLEPSVEKDAKFDGMHDLELYSGAWARAAVNPKLAEVL